MATIFVQIPGVTDQTTCMDLGLRLGLRGALAEYEVQQADAESGEPVRYIKKQRKFATIKL